MLKKVGSQKSEVSPKPEVISRTYLLPFTCYLLPVTFYLPPLIHPHPVSVNLRVLRISVVKKCRKLE